MKISYKQRFTSFDYNIALSLPINNALLGKDSVISNFIEDELSNNINPIIDNEYKIYKPSLQQKNIHFVPFFAYMQNTYSNDYVKDGFREVQVQEVSNAIRYSLYIVEIYSNEKLDKKSILSRTIITATNKLAQYNNNNRITPLLQFNNSKKFNPLSWIKLPHYFNENTAYMKISFYNASRGKIIDFANSSALKQLFFTISILNNNTYQINQFSDAKDSNNTITHNIYAVYPNPKTSDNQTNAPVNTNNNVIRKTILESGDVLFDEDIIMFNVDR